MKAQSVARNYLFLMILLLAMILGAITGYLSPNFASNIAFLGTIFIRLMFCIVVPMVFASIAGAVAGTKDLRRSGRIMWTTIITFVITGAIAAIIYFFLVIIFPPVTSAWTEIAHERLVTPADAPRSYAYCTDTRYIPTLHELLNGVNTLYHESTYGEDRLQSAEKYCHSTARQAALVAKEAGVGKLLLGHYSSRYEDENVLLEEAKKVFENTYLTNEMAVFDV